MTNQSVAPFFSLSLLAICLFPSFTYVQGAWLAIGLPPTVFLTLKLCEENGFGPWRQAAQLAVQAILTVELWHLMIR